MSPALGLAREGTGAVSPFTPRCQHIDPSAPWAAPALAKWTNSGLRALLHCLCKWKPPLKRVLPASSVNLMSHATAATSSALTGHICTMLEPRGVSEAAREAATT